MTDRILVFIPAYNCERQIPRVLASFADGEVAARFSEVLVLDNGSRDRTVAAAIEAAQRLQHIDVKVARNLANYGLGGSHKSAFSYALRAGFTHVVVLHGDDQGSIRDILPLLSDNRHLAYDCCLGARFMKGSSLKGYSLFRIFGNLVFNCIYSLAARRRISDLGSGLNMYATNFLRDEFYKKYTDGLHFNCCLLLGALARHGRIIFFPISWREDDQVSNVRLFRQARQTLELALGYAFNRKNFFAAEHREQPRDAYWFNVVAQNSKTASASAPTQ